MVPLRDSKPSAVLQARRAVGSARMAGADGGVFYLLAFGCANSDAHRQQFSLCRAALGLAGSVALGRYGGRVRRNESSTWGGRADSSSQWLSNRSLQVSKLCVRPCRTAGGGGTPP